MSRGRVLLLAASLALAMGCEKERTRNSSGVISADDTGEVTASTSVYRFVGVEKALKDARKAVEEERWPDALAAAKALLAQQQDHGEAAKIVALAELEGRSQTAFKAFKKALEDHATQLVAQSYQGIDEKSRYHEQARPEYERLRDQWTIAREFETKNLAKAGRCRESARIAHSASDYFPEVRARLEAVANDCNPASRLDEEPRQSPPVASLAPVPPAPTPAPPPVAPPAPAVKPTPPPVTTAAVKPPATTTAVKPPPAAVPAPPAVPEDKPKAVPAVELEKYRLAGDRRPSLPAGALRIAIRDKVGTITIGVAFCLSVTGEMSNIQMVKQSTYDDANSKIVDDVKRWKFRPYIMNGKPTAVCTRQVFIWQLE